MQPKTVAHHYLIAALWSSTDAKGEPLGSIYSLDDVSTEALSKALEDCTEFIQRCGPRLRPLEPEQVGHDFWLTRNGHGAGFWDRGLGVLGELLSEAARSFGECELYVGDDGLIYMLGDQR